METCKNGNLPKMKNFQKWKPTKNGNFLEMETCQKRKTC